MPAKRRPTPPPVDWCKALLRDIRPAPQLFVGGGDVRFLSTFLGGYFNALLDLGERADWSFLLETGQPPMGKAKVRKP